MYIIILIHKIKSFDLVVIYLDFGDLMLHTFEMDIVVFFSVYLKLMFFWGYQNGVVVNIGVVNKETINCCQICLLMQERWITKRGGS